MESVSIELPAALYASLYSRYGELTTATIVGALQQLETRSACLATAQAPNPYSRPGAGTKTGRVWEIADRVQNETGSATRDAVVKECMAAGINMNTANTQFTYWKKTKAH